MSKDAPEDKTVPDQPVAASRRQLLEGLGLAGLFAALPAAVEAGDAHGRKPRPAATVSDEALRTQVETIVVVFAENRSFNNLFSGFPGLKAPLAAVPAERFVQRDRDGQVLAALPKIWGGLVKDEQVVNHQTFKIGQDDIQGLPNAPFALCTPDGDPLPQGVVTRDLVHAFYQNQMQINDGKNDGFVAWGDSGALVMGHYGDNDVNLRLWNLAGEYTLCDNFFMGAFGGSFLNHQYLVAAQPPYYPDADNSPAKSLIAIMTDGAPKGIKLTPATSMPPSCMDGPARFVNSAMSPDFHVVNTMSPA